jgi:solute carrier family 25 S-adenosylmethionine transporter 26
VGIGAIQFAIFGATRNSCGPLISAALGAAGSCLVSVPQEVIKQRLVTGVYPSFRSAVATIYSADGVSGFYSGWRPTVARNIPFVVATFLSMDYLTRLRLNHKERTNENAKASLTVAENLAIGVSGALIAGTLTHPGKTRTS